MSDHFAALAYTASVRAAQHRYNGFELDVPKVETAPAPALGPREQAFIAARDSFYMATIGEGGWPHVQHRGGPAGFLKILGPATLAFADFRGNRQYVSVGNLASEPRAALILVDYPTRRRLKILGRIDVVDIDDAPAELIAAVQPRLSNGQVERILRIEVAAFDWNCSQHITPRLTEDEWRARGAFRQTEQSTSKE